jgi:hypothetical protein
MPKGLQSSKLLRKKKSRHKNKASDKQEQHTEQDGPNEFPNLRETNQTDSHIRKDSAAAELPKLDPNNHKSKPSLLAVHFIKFVKGLASNSRQSSDQDKGFQMVLCKQMGGMLMKIGNLRLT